MGNLGIKFLQVDVNKFIKLLKKVKKEEKKVKKSLY